MTVQGDDKQNRKKKPSTIPLGFMESSKNSNGMGSKEIINKENVHIKEQA